MEQMEQNIFKTAIATMIGMLLLYLGGAAFVIWVIIKLMQFFGVI